jgi:predicted nucleic acid-binding protein
VLLVDTSVWIELFRKPKRLELESVADLDEIVTCLPVIQEVLQELLMSERSGISARFTESSGRT